MTILFPCPPIKKSKKSKKGLKPMQGTGVKAPLPELSKPPGRLKKWRQDEKSRRKKEVKINVVENPIRCHNCYPDHNI